MPQSKYTRKRAFMPFEKCVKIKNDSQHDLKIRYTIQKNKLNLTRFVVRNIKNISILTERYRENRNSE